MVYRVLGIMSGSSLDGLDLALVEFHPEGNWSFEVKAAACYPYDAEWTAQLRNATRLSARDYLLLHTRYGHYIGNEINRFIEENQLAFQVQLIASHGHTSFHLPGQQTTAQLGDGAAIAATTGLAVVSDLRAMDLALGGQGAPIVPIGEQLLWPNYPWLLNIGGIANITRNRAGHAAAFDCCPANAILNRLAALEGLAYDTDGYLAAGGKLQPSLLNLLNQQSYYAEPYPKSLSNDFGKEVIYPLLEASGFSVADQLHTYVVHIATQVAHAVAALEPAAGGTMLVTGGGAHNKFLLSKIGEALKPYAIELELPDNTTIDFKEAIVMALFGLLRWREQVNLLHSATGAQKDSIGGALWLG